MMNIDQKTFVALAVRRSKFERMRIERHFDDDPTNLSENEIAEAQVAIDAAEKWKTDEVTVTFGSISHSKCPFDDSTFQRMNIRPDEPCPVCGDYGNAWSADSNCVSN
jgi:hypothetical protein